MQCVFSVSALHQCICTCAQCWMCVFSLCLFAFHMCVSGKSAYQIYIHCVVSDLSVSENIIKVHKHQTYQFCDSFTHKTNGSIFPCIEVCFTNLLESVYQFGLYVFQQNVTCLHFSRSVISISKLWDSRTFWLDRISSISIQQYS